MTSRAAQRRAAALLLVLACRPLVYTLVDEDHDEGHDETDTDQPTTDEPTPTFPDTCFDGGHNTGESDFDCGGACVPCGPGMRCDAPSDCQSNRCDDGVCAGLGCEHDGECKTDAPCALGVCTPDGTCTLLPAFDGEPCDDDDLCTDSSLCSQGKCLGEPRTCDELADQCRTPFCNPSNGKCAVEFKDAGEKCDDGLDCSQFDVCDGLGACVGQPLPPILNETFIMPQAWQLGELWQIGPAEPSMCGQPGFDDPFTDHSGDGFLAGLLIGGCTPPEGFFKTCLTSPPLEIFEPFDPIVLRWWSVLSSAGPPMEATVEIFDGQVWSPVMVFDDQTSEKNWTEHGIYLPPMPQTIQVRFCQSQKDAGMMPVGGWSIDDVTIGPAQCLP